MTSAKTPEETGCSTCLIYGIDGCGCQSGPVEGTQGRVFGHAEQGPRLWDLPIFGWAWREDGRQLGA